MKANSWFSVGMSWTVLQPVCLGLKTEDMLICYIQYSILQEDMQVYIGLITL